MRSHRHQRWRWLQDGQAWSAWLCALALLTACSATGPPEPEDRTGDMAAVETRTLTDVTERHPEAQDALDRAVGYAVFQKHSTKYPLVGRGAGFGVAVDKNNGRRHYLRVEHFDVGGGLGSLDYRLLIVFFDRSDFDRMRTGTLTFGASMDAASGAGDDKPGEASRAGISSDKRAVYMLSDEGAAATWTVRMVRFKPWRE